MTLLRTIYGFDVPMADGSDDEFEDAGEERYILA